MKNSIAYMLPSLTARITNAISGSLIQLTYLPLSELLTLIVEPQEVPI